MEGEITQLFGGWPGKNPAGAIDKVALPATAEVLFVNKPELEQAQIRIGYPGVERGNPDEPALVTASSILGGGFTSRLLEAIRVERSLSYDAHCRLIQEGRAGLLRVSTFTKSPTIAPATVTWRSRRCGNSAPTGRRRRSSRARRVTSRAPWRGTCRRPPTSPRAWPWSPSTRRPADYVPRRVERIRAVQIADVRRVAADDFAPERMCLVVVGDGAVKSQLSGLGPLREVDFTTVIE